MTTGQALADVFLWNVRPATDLERWFYGERLPYRPGARNEPRRRKPGK